MADVKSSIDQWSNTTGSNFPNDNTTIGAGLADNLQEIQGVIVRAFRHKGADLASAGTVDLGATEGAYHDITGTTSISSFGTTAGTGQWKLLQFDSTLTLTYNATSMILPGNADITTQAGDMCCVIHEGSGNWRMLWYTDDSVTSNQAGMIQMYGGAAAPPGWLLCNGAAISRTTYAKLFAVISTTYGVGDGSTSFNLPDMRDNFPVGAGSTYSRADSGGAATHTLSAAEMPVHTHTQNAHTHTQNSHTHTQDGHTHTYNTYSIRDTTPGGIFSVIYGNAGSTGSTTATNQSSTATNQNATATNQNAGSGSAHNNLHTKSKAPGRLRCRVFQMPSKSFSTLMFSKTTQSGRHSASRQSTVTRSKM
jgi:microcystin-dependent protein